MAGPKQRIRGMHMGYLAGKFHHEWVDVVMSGCVKKVEPMPARDHQLGKQERDDGCQTGDSDQVCVFHSRRGSSGM